MSKPLPGEIRMFAGNYAPRGWAMCNGQLLSTEEFPELFATIGTTYGGDGKSTFALPDMRGRIPVHRGAAMPHGSAGGSELAEISAAQMPGHTHSAVPAASTITSGYSAGAVALLTDSQPVATTSGAGFIAAAGAGAAHDNMQPWLGIHFVIALGNDAQPADLPDTFAGEVRLYTGPNAPSGWLRCDGQSMSISAYPQLFATLGTTFGGDGRDVFAVPDLRCRTALHAGQGDGLTLRKLGQAGGAAAVTLSESQLPYHSHAIVQTAGTDAGAVATDGTVTTGGPAEAHNNMQPYLVLSYIIATSDRAAG